MAFVSRRHWIYKTVYGTREGLIGHKTATGIIIRPESVFAALPSRKALGRLIECINPKTGIGVICPVMDVGPWNTKDDAYVVGGARPAAEAQHRAKSRDEFGRIPSNPAGIDLSDALWAALGMRDNGEVQWRFADEDQL